MTVGQRRNTLPNNSKYMTFLGFRGFLRTPTTPWNYGLVKSEPALVTLKEPAVVMGLLATEARKSTHQLAVEITLTIHRIGAELKLLNCSPCMSLEQLNDRSHISTA